MKKIFAIICALTLVVSCKIDGSDGYMHATPDGIVLLCKQKSSAVDYTYACFRQLYCVHLYRTYEGGDRDLMWFSTLGKCYTNGNDIMTERYNIRIKTNGLAFTDEGAVYTVQGEDIKFTCVYDGGALGWKVESSVLPGRTEVDLVYTVEDLLDSSMSLGITGMALERDLSGVREYSQTDYVRFDVDLLKPWTFSPGDNLFPSDCMFSDKDRPVGSARFSIYYKDYGLTDWAEITFAGGKAEPKWVTSRD